MSSHSVALESEKCIGCTDCIKRCPTEAIRVRGSKAKIIEERCIDCGNCIRICRNGAKKAVTDSIKSLNNYKYRIALPAPSFYAQFKKAKSVTSILSSLYDIGFTDIMEVASAAEIITKHTQDFVKNAKAFPVISSSCPAIVRLIQRRFPSLIDHVLPVISPMELAARYVKSKYIERGIDEKEVGVFFISPCPAKATEIHRPKGLEKSYVDGVFSMQEIYKLVAPKLNSPKSKIFERKSTYKGIVWATRNGSMSDGVIQSYIAVDGMESVIDILEHVEDGILSDVQFIEAFACIGGCLGGVLTIENPFISRAEIKKWIDEDNRNHFEGDVALFKELQSINVRFEKPIKPRPVFSLNNDRSKAIKMMEEIEELTKILPKIDCGSCGAPTCRCFAEDVIKGDVHLEDCIFMLRKRIKEVSEVMLELTQKVVPTQEK